MKKVVAILSLAICHKAIALLPCREIEVAELQLMNQIELVEEFCIDLIRKSSNSDLSKNAFELRHVMNDWEEYGDNVIHCSRMIERIALVYRAKFSAPIDPSFCKKTETSDPQKNSDDK